jgi:hypothetical protein
MDNKEEFRVGQRVFFPLRHGINAFGNIVEVHPEDSSVLIWSDDFLITYERPMSVVMVVKE